MENQNKDKNVMIQMSNVKKRYRLGQIGGGTLQADLQSWWARIRGKEDPNTKIGVDQRSNGETFMALNGIDLTIYKGEAVGIIGGNGAGKSTLLKILSRVTAPTEGEIDIYGRIASMLEVGTGFSPEMTGRENVYMNGAILGMTKAEIDAKMEDIIEFSEVREFIDTPVKRYSSGMYVKLAFSVAAHLDSEIMIMDEVLAVGDMAFQKKCLDKMRDVAKKEGRTVLYVSHNMETIKKLCDKCIVLDRGKVIFNGGVQEAIAMYLDSSMGELKRYYNFEGQRRSTIDRGTMVYIHSFEFIDKKIARFLSSEKMKFCINIEGKEKIDGLRIRLEIRTPSGENVGMSESQRLINLKKGETQDVELLYDISNLAEGTYTLRLTVFILNEMGTHKGLDETTELIYFEIVEDEKNRTNWMPQYWGRIKLPSVERIS